MNTFAVKRVWTAQHRSRDVRQSVWEPVFLHVMIEILQDGSWKEYPHEVWDRTCKFSAVEDFLTSEDGLGWPDIQATCAMIRAAADSPAAVSIRLGANTTLRDLAQQCLRLLAAHGVAVPSPVEQIQALGQDLDDEQLEQAIAALQQLERRSA